MIKKILLAAVLLVSGTCAIAQHREPLKPEQGSVTADFSLLANGFNSRWIDLGNSMLRGRYFLNDNGLALRGALRLSSNKKTESNETQEAKSSENGLELGLGIEKHFRGTRRLSPYIGAELLINHAGKSSENIVKNNATLNTKVEGPNTFGIGAGLMLGADYYIARNLYLGVEAGYRFMNRSVGETSRTNNLGTKKNGVTGSNFNIETGALAGFRIGFVF